MFARLFSRSKKPDPAALLADLVACARAVEPYRDLGVADTFEGRFEYLALVTTPVLDRLAELGAPGQALSQELVDAIFTHLDDGLRRRGVGDLSVGKHMKKLAKSFYGRVNAYREGLADAATLRAALARNLYGGAMTPEAVPAALLARIEALRGVLAAAPLETLAAGGLLAGKETA